MSEKEKINVIFIGTYNKSEILSGPEKVCKRIFEEYSDTDKTLFVHYFQDGNKYSYFKKLFGYEKTSEVNGSEVLMLGILRMLCQVIKLNPRNIHILCFNRFAVFLYLLKIFSRVKIYYTLNGIIRHENRYYNIESKLTIFKNIVVENIMIYFSDKIFYLSEVSKSILSLYYSPDSTKLSKAINGLDKCFLEQGNSDLYVKEDKTIVFIGNIDQKEKGFDFLIYTLLSSSYKTKLFIIDSSDKMQRFKTYPNLEIIVVNKMPPHEMIEFLKNKSIIAATSKYDTFNISVLEAISCGLYPILTKQTGISEIMGDNIPSSIIDYGDKNSLTSVFENLKTNKRQYNIFTMLNEFSWHIILEKYYIPHYD